MTPIIVPLTGGMTFGDLRTELEERGFSYLGDNATNQARRDRWLNQGQRDLCAEEPWDFLITTASGSSPLTITDLRDVLSVSNATIELQEYSRDQLSANDPALSQTGNPYGYWRNGRSELNTYPSDGTAWTVRYLAVPPEMVADDDIPVVPEEWRYLIVDFAVMRALRDRSNFAEADALFQAIHVDLERMREALMTRPRYQQQTDPEAAYG